MKICMINGSPKLGKSNSGLLTDYLAAELRGNEIKLFNISKAPLTQTQLEAVQNCEALVFAFPLYIDSIPSHLLRQLIQLEKQKFTRADTRVYCMLNNGFYEGRQNHVAVEQMKHWCRSAGLIWGQAFGIGAGEMMPAVANIPLGHGPNKNIGRAIRILSSNILDKKSGEDIFTSPNWPRFLWRAQATLFWYAAAKKNGLKKRNLSAKR